MIGRRGEINDSFDDYLKKSGLYYFYESLNSFFVLVQPETKKVMYANPVAKEVLGDILNKNSLKFTNVLPNPRKHLAEKILRNIDKGKIEHDILELYNLPKMGNLILRFQKVTIGKNQLVVIFAVNNDPEKIKKYKKQIKLETNYLNTLYKISKLIDKLSENESETLVGIADTISQMFEVKTLWVRFKINDRFYASSNFNDKNRIYSRRINTGDGNPAYMEIGLTKKTDKLRGLHFSVEEERVFDEIIERLESAILQKRLKEKLLENEKRFRSIIENASDAIIVTDELGEIIDANRKSELIFSRTEDEIIGRKITDLFPDLTHDEIVDAIIRENSDNRITAAPLEKTITYANGETTYCEINIASWALDYKNLYSFFIRDVTQRKKHEEQILYRSKFEQLLAQISAQFIESGIDGIEKGIVNALRTLSQFLGSQRACIYLLDKEKGKINCVYEWTEKGTERFIDVSQSLEIKTFSEILNELTEKSVYTANRENVVKSFLPYLRLRKIQSILGLAFYQHDEFAGLIGFEFAEKNFVLKEEDAPLLSLFSKILGGEMEQLRGELERREIEAQMRKLQEAIRQSANAVVITDINGNIEYVNPKFEELTGYSFEEVKGKNPRILKSGYTPKEEYEKLWETISSGKEWKGVFKNKAKDGTFFWENAIISPIKNKEGKITNYLAVKENITEQIKMKNQLDLSRKMEAIGQLAAGVAHEINTPMQFISDNVRFLKTAFEDFIKYYWEVGKEIKSEIGDELTQKIEKIIARYKEKYDINYIMEEIPSAIEQTNEGIERVTKIIKTMKDFSHPSTGQKAPADINKAINDTILISRNVWKYVAELETDLCEEPPLITCEIDQINQVLLNIIVNAAQAIEEKNGKNAKEKGLIKIHTECDDEFLTIKISDNGVGIPSENIDKIFEPFFTTKQVGKGTGQGLALAHDIIVNKHGGTIEVESEEGKGTLFIIKLPKNGEDEK